MIPRRVTVAMRGWLLCGLGALSCSGKAFTSTEASGGAAGGPGGRGGAGDASIGISGASGMGDAGASGMSDAGGGNSPDGVDCSAFNGQEFGGHCYVDATVESSSAQQAVRWSSSPALRAPSRWP